MRLKLPILIAVFLAAAPVWAHHGTRPEETGHLEVAGADGKVATWLVNILIGEQ